MIKINLIKGKKETVYKDVFTQAKEKIQSANKESILIIVTAIFMLGIVGLEFLYMIKQKSRLSMIEREVSKLDKELVILKSKAKSVENKVKMIRSDIKKLEEEIRFLNKMDSFLNSIKKQKESVVNVVMHIHSFVSRNELLYANHVIHLSNINKVNTYISVYSYNDSIINSFINYLQRNKIYLSREPENHRSIQTTRRKKDKKSIIEINTEVNPYGIRLYKAKLNLMKNIYEEDI